jgi:transposase-like protein
MSGKKGMTHYSKAIKERAVKMFLEDGVNYREIAEKLEIRDSERIEKWVQMYRREGAASFEKPVGRPRKEMRPQTELERLRMENDLLKKYHAELRKMELEKRNIG